MRLLNKRKGRLLASFVLVMAGAIAISSIFAEEISKKEEREEKVKVLEETDQKEADKKTEDEIKDLEEVVVTGKEIKEPVYKSFPSTVNDISAEDIEKIKPINVTDILRTVPGVTYIDEDGRGLRPSIGIRGLDPQRSRNVLILIDGFPAQGSIYGDPSAYYNVPVEQIDHVEVIKGGSTLLYGANATGGVINYITKKPSYKPFEIQNKETVGSDNFFSSQTHAGGTSGKYSYMGSIIRKQGDGFRDRSEFDVFDASAYLRYEIDNHQDLTWRTYGYYEDSETPGGLTQAQYDKDFRQSQFSEDFFEGRRVSTNLTYHNKLDENQNLEAYVNYLFFSRDWFIARLAPTNQQVKRDFNVFSFGGKYHLDYDLFWMDGNRLTFGNEYYFDKEDDIRENGKARDSRSGVRSGDNDLTTFAYAFYGVTDLHFTERLTISPILRMDNVQSGIENKFLNLKEREITDMVWSPGIGVDYAVNPTSHIYASYHESFKPMEFRESVDFTTGTVNDLEPERGRHYEIGFKSQPAGWFSYDLAAFLFDIDNEIITEGSALTNGGETRHAGIEGAASLGLLGIVDRFWGLSLSKTFGDLSTNFNFTFLDTEFRKGPNKGNELPYAPDWHINWSVVNYYHPKGFSANLSAEWVDGQFSDAANSRVGSASGLTGPIPSYNVWNTNVGYKVNDHFDVFFAVKNLFDERYFSRRDTFFGGIDPAPDRQFYGGVTIKF